MASARTAASKENRRGVNHYLTCGKCGGYGGKVTIEVTKVDKDGKPVKMYQSERRTLRKVGEKYLCQACQ